MRDFFVMACKCIKKFLYTKIFPILFAKTRDNRNPSKFLHKTIFE